MLYNMIIKNNEAVAELVKATAVPPYQMKLGLEELEQAVFGSGVMDGVVCLSCVDNEFTVAVKDFDVVKHHRLATGELLVNAAFSPFSNAESHALLTRLKTAVKQMEGTYENCIEELWLAKDLGMPKNKEWYFKILGLAELYFKKLTEKEREAEVNRLGKVFLDVESFFIHSPTEAQVANYLIKERLRLLEGPRSDLPERLLNFSIILNSFLVKLIQ